MEPKNQFLEPTYMLKAFDYDGQQLINFLEKQANGQTTLVSDLIDFSEFLFNYTQVPAKPAIDMESQN